MLALFDELGPRLSDANIVAVEHRVVMGGEHFADAVLIDAEVLATTTGWRRSPRSTTRQSGRISVARDLLPAFRTRGVDTALFHDLPLAAATYTPIDGLPGNTRASLRSARYVAPVRVAPGRCCAWS